MLSKGRKSIIILLISLFAVASRANAEGTEFVAGGMSGCESHGDV